MLDDQIRFFLFEFFPSHTQREFEIGRVDLRGVLSRVASPPSPYALVPAHGLAPAVLAGRAAWLREALSEGGGIAPEAFPDWGNELVHLRTFFDLSPADGSSEAWRLWATAFGRAEAALHWGTSHWVDTTFYARVYDVLERERAPARARAAADLMHSFSLGDWEGTAEAADELVSSAATGERWGDPATLMEVAVLAYLRVDRATSARQAFELLAPRTGRPTTHLRNRLLDALIAEAEAGL